MKKYLEKALSFLHGKYTHNQTAFFLNLEKLLIFVIYISRPLFFVYVFSMLLYPLHYLSWEKTQKIWSEWQTFNAGVIAYIAAVLVYTSSKAAAIEERKLRGQIDRAKLSRALSSICNFSQQSIDFILSCKSFSKSPLALTTTYLGTPPVFDEKALDIIASSIASSEREEVSNFLTKMLHDIQIIESRLDSFQRVALKIDNSNNITDSFYLNSCIGCLVIHRNASSAFDYSRKNLPIDKSFTIRNSIATTSLSDSSKREIMTFINNADNRDKNYEEIEFFSDPI